MSPHVDSSQFLAQWSNPGDILSLLMIIGGEVIQRALAQVGGGILTPVTFSFGWVAYAFNSLTFVVGGGNIMPSADHETLLINGKQGYVRENRSWILGRAVRDFDHWMPKTVDEVLQQMLTDAEQYDREAARKSGGEDPFKNYKRERAGLCISIFKTSDAVLKVPGVPSNDWVYYSGIFVALLQLGVAAIPVALSGQWSVILITASGTLLAFASGALPQWGAEKWKCRRREKTVTLTEGNGAQHAIVIIGQSGALDLEDLATGSGERSMVLSTRACLVTLLVLWIMLLISVSGLEESRWFVILVGSIGMVHNVVVAGAPRRPEAFGLHLEFVKVIGNVKAMKALMALEETYPRVGASLVPIFFPGKLRKDEETFWNEQEKKNA
ncbi:hypothetical protein BDZ94DRAFT_1282335 [Collybia nuda]|uniref:Uncharacterized protein n=1 Tax=Collybia nuda TaxID=64659 RepID=A0A9P5Y848_9AGAR|nr:hypothetical protein BDZ94DRAFT_1282335 [Collybia nuda]